MSKSNIEWTTETWNPVVGCSILSPGCTHCYAMGMAARIEAMNAEARASGQDGTPKRSATAPHYDGTTKKVNGHAVWTGKLAIASDNVLLAPLKRKKPTTYFVNSMGDLFHEDVPDEWIDRVFAVMALCPQHTFQVLTKRAKRMQDYLAHDDAPERSANIAQQLWSTHLAPHSSGALKQAVVCDEDGFKDSEAFLNPRPLPNVWLGVSTERQQEADERIPLLLQTPAAIRFISAEPLLGPIDLTAINFELLPGYFGDVVRWHHQPYSDRHIRYPALDWVIVGGESGPGSRPMHPDWARSLRNQCVAAGVPFFFKQWGEWGPVCAMNDAQIDALYVPAPERHPEATRRCKVPHLVLHADGTKFPDVAAPMAFAAGTGAMTIFKTGKKFAGRALDGMIHNEMPETAR